MFDGNIIKEYVEVRESEDVLSACRAVVKQCFDKYGGTGYENFYYPYSGLFEQGTAPDWFVLYDNTTDGEEPKSPCAQQLSKIASCKDVLEKAFGGFDIEKVNLESNGSYKVDEINGKPLYGLANNEGVFRHRDLRSVGVATEVYNQIIDTLSTQCMNINGRFMEVQFLQNGVYNSDNYCQWNKYEASSTDLYSYINSAYGLKDGENMCPRDYSLSVDIKSWGVCSCWGNGGRRSENGNTAICVAEMPGEEGTWKSLSVRDSANRVCPKDVISDEGSSSTYCKISKGTSEENLSQKELEELVPEGI
jgi:hypothetical protein